MELVPLLSQRLRPANGKLANYLGAGPGVS